MQNAAADNDAGDVDAAGRSTITAPAAAASADELSSELEEKQSSLTCHRASSTPWKSSDPEGNANFLSRLVFWWVQPLFTRAAKLHKNGEALEQDDLIPLASIDSGRRIAGIFDASWITYDAGRKVEDTVTEEKEKKKKNDAARKDLEKQLKHSLLSIIGKRFIVAGVVKFFNTGLQFSFPLLLNAILSFYEEIQTRGDEVGAGPNPNKGYWLSGLLLIAMGAKAVTENAYFHLVYRCGYQTKVAVSAAVYEKSLRLASSERGSTTLGELVNLMQVDASKIEMFVPQIHVLWDGLLQIVGYIIILYTLIGWPCFIGLIVLLASGPLQGKIMKLLFGLNRKMVKYTDERVKTTNEALQGILCVKMYTWEKSFAKSISKSRDEELRYLKVASYLRGCSRAVVSSLPGIVAVVSFVVYASAAGGVVSASILFAALAAFDQLRFPLIFYPVALAQLAQASISVGRVSVFLGMKEVRGGDGLYESSEAAPGTRTGEISFEAAKIYWNDPKVPILSVKKEETQQTREAMNVPIREDDDPESVEAYPKPVLSDVTFSVGRGQLCAVIGRVGSGKSSLCSSVLNETILGEGRISISGKVAYVAQTAWILNATLRDNILFGQQMDKERYDAVLEACQLTHDLSILNHGDLSEIGERGINLSGGQRQRVSLARAAYSNADIIILDDTLSALDPKVGERVFSECILGLMEGKTRLFVTNQLQCLKRCDLVVVIGEGRVLEEGTYNDLMQKDDGEVRRLLNELGHANDAAKTHGEASNNKSEKGSMEAEPANKADVNKAKDSPQQSNSQEGDGTLTTKEERAVGAVKLNVYKKYIHAGGGCIKFSVVYFAFILTASVELLKNAWISLWTADSMYQRHSIGFYMSLYASTAVALGVVTFVRSFLLAIFGVRASKTLHDELLQSVFRAPLFFFDTTPTGRIISRFSKDLFSIDSELSETFDFFLWGSLYVVISLATITFATPWFGVAIVPIGIIYLRVLNYFRDVSRETKRLESISRSPVYAHFSESLGGLATIRAYGQSQRFIKDFLRKVDQNTRAYSNIKVADRWLSVRLELLGSIVAGLAAICATYVSVSNSTSGISTGSNFASLAGLSLSYAISVTGVMNWCVRSFANLEAGMNATERVLYYSEQIPQEAAANTDTLEARVAGMPSPPPPSDPSAFAVAASGGTALRPKRSWPENGQSPLQTYSCGTARTRQLYLRGSMYPFLVAKRLASLAVLAAGRARC